MVTYFGVGIMIGSLISMYLLETDKDFGWGMVIGSGMVTVMAFLERW